MKRKEPDKKEELKKDVVENIKIEEEKEGKFINKVNEDKKDLLPDEDKTSSLSDDNEEKDETPNIQPKDLGKKQNNLVIFAIILMVSILLIILLIPYVMKNYINKFTYINLDFYKTKIGKINFYSTIIPLTDKQMNLISDYPLNLRNDPRKLDYIKVNVSENQIIFKKFLPVYISLQSDSPRCEDNMIAVVGLSQFLKEFANLTVKAAMDNKTYANKTGYPYVTCINYPTNTVIYLTSGNSTEITKINDNCYELVYSNCEITQVTERFMLIILENYMNYFKRY